MLPSRFASLPALARAVPLCFGLVFVMAAEDECTIRIVTDDDDCEDVDEVCNLDCELATNEDGCRICECADDPPPPPPAECQSDADCGDGQYCELLEACPPCVNDDPACEPACSLEGRCVDIPTDPCALVDCSPDTICVVDESGQPLCVPTGGDECLSDADCGERAFCDFTTCNGGGEERPDGDGLVCVGTCREIDEPLTCENVLCDEGTHCVEGFGGPICVPNESECNVDEDCVNEDGSVGRCELLCLPIPGCPECDACMVVGQCVDDQPPPPPPTGECLVDADCGEGARCNTLDVCLPGPDCVDQGNGLVACDAAVCWGRCEAPTCQSDADCGADEVCALADCAPGCDPNEPNGGECFAPCEADGRCVPAP